MEPGASAGAHVALVGRGLSRVFGRTVALRRVDVDARSGDLLAIHGPNASGKSTLLQVIGGLLPPTAGTATWVRGPGGQRPRIAVVGHRTHLLAELTALENVRLAARLARRGTIAPVEWLERLGVAAVAGSRVGQLSAGSRRRVGLARALATEPDVVIVDEPFAGLDEAAADRVAAALVACREARRLVVIATHDDAKTRGMATRALWLAEGMVARTARPGEFVAAR